MTSAGKSCVNMLATCDVEQRASDVSYEVRCSVPSEDPRLDLAFGFGTDTLTLRVHCVKGLRHVLDLPKVKVAITVALKRCSVIVTACKGPGNSSVGKDLVLVN